MFLVKITFFDKNSIFYFCTFSIQKEFLAAKRPKISTFLYVYTCKHKILMININKVADNKI